MERYDSKLFNYGVNFVRPFIEEGQSAEEIARVNNVNRASVYRAIHDATERGCIKKIVDLVPVIKEERDVSLEHKLGEKFGIDSQVFQVPESLVGERFDYNKDTILQAFLGKASAQALYSVIHSGEYLGIGGGRTIQSLAEELYRKKLRMEYGKVSMVRSLAGGIQYDLSQLYPNSSADYNAYSVARAINGKRLEISNSYSFNKNPKQILSNRINIVVFEPNTVFPQAGHELFSNPYVDSYVPEIPGFADLIDEAEDSLPSVEHPVIEIFNRFKVVQNDGSRNVRPEIVNDLAKRAEYLNEFSVGVSWEELRDNVDVRLAIVGGPHKYNAVKVALDEGLVTNLVTDQVLARMLVDGSKLNP